jgi:prepilin-type N-terminal cleavage/methylation domain-containing protein
MKFMRSQSGMSLIEIMMAVSILSVISVSVVMLSKNMDKSMKSAELKADMESVTRDIAQLMSVKENCSATVAGASGSGTPVPNTFLSSIKVVNSRNQVEAHPRYKVSSITNPLLVGSGIMINGMYLKHLSDNVGSGASYELRITFIKSVRAAEGNQRVRDTFYGQNAETKKIPLQLDNCQRYMAVGRQNGTGAPISAAAVCTSAGGQLVGEVIVVNSGGAPTTPDTFQMVGCRVCSTRTSVRACI